MQITDSVLSWLLVIAISIGISGTVIDLDTLESKDMITGYAAGTTYNTTGNASVTVATSTVLRFAIAGLNFGSGGVDTSSGNTTCNVATNNSLPGNITKYGCTGFTNNVPALVLENAGNTHMNVTLNFSSNASVFLGGTSPSLKYLASGNESSSCGPGATPGTWTEVVPNSLLNICTNLSWAEAGDSLKVGLNITIPQDALQGAKSLNITAQGTSLY
jgi:hypothetical protein